MKVFGNRVLLEELNVKQEDLGGLIIPDNQQELPQEFKVVGIGTDVKNDSITVDDTVVIAQGRGTEIKKDDKVYLILDVEDILAKV